MGGVNPVEQTADGFTKVASANCLCEKISNRADPQVGPAIRCRHRVRGDHFGDERNTAQPFDGWSDEQPVRASHGDIDAIALLEAPDQLHD